MKNLILALLGFLSMSLYAQVPKTLSFQGYLTNPSGEPITDNALTVSFSLYDANAEGNLVWGPELHDLNIELGIFSAILGSTLPLNVSGDLTFDKPYFLQIIVDPSGSAESLPRIALTSSAYSIGSVNAANITINQLAVANGGTGAADATLARTNLGVAIGSDVQAYDADLDTYSGITPSADIETLLSSTNNADIRENIGVEIGADVQAYDTDLTMFAGISPSPDVLSMLRASNNDAILDSLGIDVGGAVQPVDDGLTSISGLTTSADQMLYTTGLDSYTTTALTSIGRSILGDATAADVRTTISAQTADDDLTDLADGSLSGSKVGTGIDAENITTNQLAVTNGGTGAATASAARSNLGLTLGTDVQAFDADLTTYAGITPSSDVQSMLGAADDAAIRSSVGLVIGTDVQAFDADLSTYAGITPTTDVQTMLSAADEAGIRSSIGSVIGTDVQAYDVGLNSIAGLTPTSDQMLYTTGINTYSSASLTGFARSILDDANEAAFKATVNLEIGDDVQAYDAGLNSISGLTTATDRMIYTTGSDTYAVTSLTSFGRSILDDASEAAFKATVNLEAGTDIQAYDAGLNSIAGLTTAADRMIYTIGSDSYATATLTSFGRSILDDANEATFKATVNLEIGIDVQAYDAGLNDIAALTPTVDQMLYTIGTNNYSTTALTSFARSILDDASEAAFKSTVNLEIGTDIQAYDPDLVSIANGASNESTGANAIAIGQNNDADGDNSIVIGSYVRTSSGGTGSVYIGDRSVTSVTSATTSNRFYARFENGYALYTNDDLSSGVIALNGATSWSSVSDSTKKENFQDVDGEILLSRLEDLKLGTWNYKFHPDTRRQFGPFAQEFFAAFGFDGIGNIGNDTLISTQTISGVNMTAIKALVKRTNELKNENDRLKSMINEMKSELDELERLKYQITSLLGKLEAAEMDNKTNELTSTTRQ